MHSKFPFLYCTNLSFFKLLFCFYWFFLCNEKAKGQSTFTASLPLATSYVFESCPGGTTINFQFTGLAANQRIRLYGQPAPPTSYNSWLPIGLSALTEAAGGSPPIYTAPGAGISFNGFPGGIAHIRAGGGGTFAQSLGPGQPFPTCAPNITNPLFTTSAARRIYVCNNTLHINAATTTIGAAVNKFSLEIPNLYTDGKKFFATRFNLQIETNSINPATFYFAFAHTALGGASHVLRVIDDGVTVGPHNPGGALQFGVAGNNVIISAWDENAYVAILTTNNPTFEIEIYAYNTTNTTEKLLFTRGSSTYTLECGLNNGQYLVFINGMPYRFGLQGDSTLEFGGFGFAAHSGTTDPNQAPQIKITNWFYQLFDVATNDQTNLGGMVHVYTSTSQSANTTNTGIGIGIYTAQQFLEDIPPGIVTVTGFSIPFTGTVYAAVYNTQTHREETPRVPITLILHPTPSTPTLPSIIGRCGGPGLVTFTFQAGASHNGNSLNIPNYTYTTTNPPPPGHFTQSPSIGSVNTTAATDYTITLNATGNYSFAAPNPNIQYVRRTPSAPFAILPGCVANLGAVTLTVNPNRPPAPSLAASTIFACPNSQVTFTANIVTFTAAPNYDGVANSGDYRLRLYSQNLTPSADVNNSDYNPGLIQGNTGAQDDATSWSLSTQPNAFMAPSATTTYYLGYVNNNPLGSSPVFWCQSERTPITVQISTAPVLSNVSINGNAPLCNNPATSVVIKGSVNLPPNTPIDVQVSASQNFSTPIVSTSLTSANLFATTGWTANIASLLNDYQTTTLYVRVRDANVTTCWSAPVAVNVGWASSFPNNTVSIAQTQTPCASGTAVFTFSWGSMPPAGYRLRLYAAATGGSPVATSTLTNNIPTLTPPAINTNTNFWYAIYDEGSGCEVTTRTNILAQVYGLPSISTAGVSNCGAGQVTFTVNIATPSATPIQQQFRLFAAATGGTPLQTVTFTSSLPITTTNVTVNVTTTTTFYGEWINTFSNNTCTTATRLPMQATVVNLPPTPTVNNISICNNATVQVTFTVGVASGIVQVALYSTATATTPLATSNVPLSTSPLTYGLITPTPGLSQGTTTFYIEAINASNCASARKEVTATRNLVPAAPTTSEFTPPFNRCGNGAITFSATTLPDNVANGYRLYSQSTGGAVISSDFSAPYTLSTPSLSIGTYTYYIESVNNNTNCVSATRLMVVANVFERPALPTIQNVTFCGSSVVTFTVVPASTGPQPVPSSTKVWDAASGGNDITTQFNISSTPFTLTTINPINTNRNYFVSVVDANGCASDRRQVSATVQSQPAQPTVQVNNRCGAGNLTFTVSGGPASAEYRLYDNNNNQVGSVQSPGNTITFNNAPVGMHTFEVEVSNLVSPGCTSLRRSVMVTVFDNPAAPTANAVTRCGPGLVAITAMMGSPAGNEIRLYSSPSATNFLATSNVSPYILSTNVQGNAILWLEARQTSSNCTSLTRTPVTVTINPQPNVPDAVVVANTTTCGNFQPILHVRMNNGAPGDGVRVYNQSTGGNLIASCSPCSTVVGSDGLTYHEIQLPLSVSTNTNFFVSATESTGNCESQQRRQVQVTVNAVPGQPSANATIRVCANSSLGASQVTFTASMGNPAGNEIRLYANLNDINPVFSSNFPPYQMQILNLATGTYTYYLEARSTSTSCASNRVPVVIDVQPQPQVPSNSGGDSYNTLAQRCGPGQASFTVVYNNSQNIALRLYRGESDVTYADEDRIPDFGNTYILASPPISTQTTFYISAINVLTGCESARVPVIGIINANIAAPPVSDVRRCGPGQFNFSITVSTFENGSFMRLYDSQVGGQLLAQDFNPVQSANNPGQFVFELSPTNSYNQTTDFWVAYENSNACSSPRVRVRGIIIPIPGAPTAANVTRCGSGPVQITAQMGTPAGTRIRLFTEASDLAVAVDSATAAPYVITTEQGGNNTLYIASVLQGCQSPKTPVTITVVDNTGSIFANNAFRCGFGTVTFTVNVSGYNGATEVRLYTEPQGGVPVSTATSPFELTSPAINTSATFYISAFNGNANCESANRTPVTVTVTPGPSAPVVASDQLSFCGSSNVSISVNGLPSGATQLRLYSVPFGGTQVQSPISFPPFRFNVGTVVNSTIYYVAAGNGACESERVPVVVLINEPPSIPNSQSVARCGAGAVTFTATFGTIAGSEMRLFDNAGNLVASDASVPFELSASVNATSNFQIRAFDASTGCLSPARLVTATVNAHPGAALAQMSVYSRCGNGTVTITVSTVAPAGNELRLYTAAQGGAPVASSTNMTRITTPFTTQSTTYYLEQYNVGTMCASVSRTPIEIRVSPMVSAPSAQSRTIGCGPGNSTQIEVQMGSVPGDVVYLYTQAVGGVAVSQATMMPFVLQTPPVLAQTTFYVAAANSQTGCESDRVAVVVSVTNQAPSLPNVSNVALCSGSQAVNPVFTVSMGAVVGNEVRLYTQATGGSPVAVAYDAPYVVAAPTPITTTTTYYVSVATGSCESARRAVVATVGSLPGLPVVSNVFRCPAGAVTFTVTPGAGAPTLVVRMYTNVAATVPAQIDNSAPFNFTVTPATNTTYYFTAVNGNCETERVAAAAIVDAPSQPLVSGGSRCGSGNVTFSLNFPSGSVPVSEVRLFDATGQFLRASDNSAPFELSTFVTTTTNFIVRAYAANGTCVSSDLQVTAVVGGDLSAPSVANPDISQCGTAPATVSVSLPANSGVNVYDAPSGGNLIASFPAGAGTLQLPAGTYFLASVSPICESSSRSQVRITSVVVPARPVVSNVSFCGNVPVVFSARMGVPAGSTMVLYTTPTGGQPVTSTSVPDGNGNYLLGTPTPLTGNATFYVAAVNQGCESSRAEVVATRNAALPAPSVAGPVNLCGPGEATLSVNVGNAQVEQVLLYTSLTGGTAIRSATAPFVLQTPVVSAPGATFFVESVAGGCVSPRTAVFVSVGAGSQVSAPSGGATSRCGAGPVTIVANLGPGGGTEIRLYSTPTGGTILASDNSSPFELTTTVSTSTTFYLAALGTDGCESQRTPVLVTVSPTPSEPFAANVTRCGAGSVSISVTQGPIPGDEVRVYTQSTGGVIVAGATSAPYIVTVNVSTTTEFFIAAANLGGCESSRRRVLVEVTGGPTVTVNSLPATCGQGGSISALASGGSGNYTYNLDNGLTNSVGTFSNLVPGPYVLSVRDNATGCVVTRNVVIGAPSGPANVNVSNITGTSATVSWSAVAGAVSYTVRYGTGGNFTTVTVPANQLSTVINTIPNSNYDVQVFATCSGNVTTSTTGTTFTSVNEVSQACGSQRQGICQTPVNIQVSNVTATSATISWTPNEDGQGSAVCYAIRYGIAGTNPNAWPQFLIPHPGCALQATNLVPGQNYQVQVRTNCSNCSFSSGVLTPYSSGVQFSTPGNRSGEAEMTMDMGLRVYPNPSSGVLSVSFKAGEAGGATLRITDVTGRVIYSQGVRVEVGENQVVVDLSGQAQGVYFLEVAQGTQRSTLRVILN